jgi:hypothetical protein
MPRRHEPDPLAAAIGRRIRGFREEQGLRLEQVAFAGGLASKGHLSDLEHGRVIPTVTTLRGVAEELGVTLMDLVNVDTTGVRAALFERSRALPESLLARWLEEAATHARSAECSRVSEAAVELVRSSRRSRAMPRGVVPVVELDALVAEPDASPVTKAIGWVKLDARSRALPGAFVARVRGDSMAPRVPDGAYCLFRRPGPGNRRGRVFLVEAPSARSRDEAARGGDTQGEGGAHALRLLERTSVRGEARVTLRSLNPAYPPRTLDPARTPVRVVAELVRVLPSTAS